MRVRAEKNALRSRMKTLRSRLDGESVLSLGARIEERCAALPEFRAARMVHVYVSAVNNEVPTLGLIRILFDDAKTVVVPRCGPGKFSLQHFRLDSLHALKPSRFGLLEPECVPGDEVAPAELDIIIVPLLAFDRSGARLGFGGGYYDSLFRCAECPKVGLAYSFQEVSAIPVEPHDEMLDLVVTEKETIRFR